ncbi:hypothetical protein BC833DRAFT_597174 [Globomyces pollinis-pini]|nr:hypothetical protein BC833DRAFT_597174 [Globomyces pollinis-pini]
MYCVLALLLIHIAICNPSNTTDIKLNTTENQLFKQYVDVKVKDSKGGLKASTELRSKLTQAPKVSTSFPSSISFKSVVDELFNSISQVKSKEFLIRLTQFPERHYQTANGVAAANWIYNQVKQLSVPSPTVNLTVRFFNHTDFRQPSVIARLESTVPSNISELVIIGTHFDTMTYVRGSEEWHKGGTGKLYKDGKGFNPGADDCASGSSVVFESLRILITNKFIPKRPIEFHWYAGEEDGLLGSKDVAEDYAERKVQVKTYFNLDQTGYVEPGMTPVIGIMTDYVDDNATTFLRMIAKTYSGYPSQRIVDTACGHACTDHASWHAYGYPAVLPFESILDKSFPFNDHVEADGSFLDTPDKINYDHLTAFLKTSIGFLVELSLAPVSNTASTNIPRFMFIALNLITFWLL